MSARILIVEDDDAIASFLSDALVDEGYDVRLAGNGREGLAMLEGWQPALILLDLVMPGMDGWAFRAEQRRRPGMEGVPIVVMSAGRDLADSTAPMGAVALFEKPFDLNHLLKVVGQHVVAV